MSRTLNRAIGRHLLACCIGLCFAVSSAYGLAGDAQAFRELLEMSLKEKKGLTFYVNGQTIAGAVTRFVLVRPPAAPPPPSPADRTTVIAFIRDDHPGALLELLTEFAVRGVNLTRIESRPTGVGLGRYYFSIDAEGHIASARVAETLAALRRECADVRFLGSYPRADGVAATERSGTADVDFADAHAWVEALRRGHG